MSDPERKRWADRGEVAAYLGVHPITVTRLANDGKLTRHHLSEQVIRYDLDQVDAFVKSCAANTGS
jgi:Helix-turn-helix domain